MLTRVPIVNRAEARELTGKEWGKLALTVCAVKVAASELLGRHVCDLHGPLLEGQQFYAMPADRARREVRAGRPLLLEKISKRYVYVRTL